MRPNSSLTRVGVALLLFIYACGGDKDPDPCPSVPPCITGSTWNATVCACLRDDEFVDAHVKADHSSTTDAGTDASEDVTVADDRSNSSDGIAD